MICSQPMGLTAEAEKFLKENSVKLNEWPCCHRYDGYKREVIDTCGMYEDVKLYGYTLLDGSTANEFVQHCVWCSGPMEWMGLRTKDTQFLWPEEEMKH